MIMNQKEENSFFIIEKNIIDKTTLVIVIERKPSVYEIKTGFYRAANKIRKIKIT